MTESLRRRSLAALVLAELALTCVPSFAQDSMYEIGPGDGVNFYQMNWFYTGGTELNSRWGRCVFDTEKILEKTELPKCYLNVHSETGWVIQNLPVDGSKRFLDPMPGFGTGMPQHSTYFDLGEGGMMLTTLPALAECNPSPLVTFDPEGEFRSFPISPDFADPGGAGDEDITSPGAAPPVAGVFDPLGETTVFVQPSPVNIDTQINQCFPMSMANSLQWLENRYGLEVPHDHKVGSFNDDSLVGQLDEAADRSNGNGRTPGGVWFSPMMIGKFRYLKNNGLSNALVQKHQGRGYGQTLSNGNFASNGIVSEDAGATINFDWICDQLKQGEDVELVYRHSSGGHAVRLIGCGKILGRPFLQYLHDRQQGIPNSGLETPMVFVDDIDNDGQLNFGSATREITFVMSESVTDEVKNASSTPWSFSEALGNAADFVGKFVRGTISSAFGVFNSLTGEGSSQLNASVSALSAEPGHALTLPTTIDGVTVYINGRPAPLFATTTRQINFQIPYETELGAASVVIEVNGETTALFTILVEETGPAIFLLPEVFAGPNRAIVQNLPAFSLNTPGNPIVAGNFVVVYLIGIGDVTNPVPTGEDAPLAGPFSQAVSSFSATVGGVDATVAFLGLTPGSVALAQANILVPASLPTGDHLVVITVNGVASNALLISVQGL